jgi:hypothetical protein
VSQFVATLVKPEHSCAAKWLVVWRVSVGILNKGPIYLMPLSVSQFVATLVQPDHSCANKEVVLRRVNALVHGIDAR